jgi:CDP-diacylglycerol--glycerol-3-phosphate 3-phosphatidyltransferase
VFLGFLVEGFASPWAIACIFYRDAIVSTIRVLAASQGVIVSARWSGKLKAVVQGTAIVTIMVLMIARGTFGLEFDADGADPLRESFSRPVMWGVAVVTLFSLGDYLWGNRRILAALDR